MPQLEKHTFLKCLICNSSYSVQETLKDLSSTCYPKNLLSAHDQIRIKILTLNFTLGCTKMHLTQWTTDIVNSKTWTCRHEDQGLKKKSQHKLQLALTYSMTAVAESRPQALTRDYSRDCRGLSWSQQSNPWSCSCSTHCAHANEEQALALRWCERVLFSLGATSQKKSPSCLKEEHLDPSDWCWRSNFSFGPLMSLAALLAWFGV